MRSKLPQRQANTGNRSGLVCGYPNLALVCILTAMAAPAAADEDTNLLQLPRLTAEDLRYEGAFRVPRSRPDENSFSYGGTGIAFNAQHNSLFIVGHVRYQTSAEIAIPRIVNSRQKEDLEVASFIQQFQDALEGKRRSINPDNREAQRIGGHFVFGNRLIVSAYSNYDAGGTQNGSHFSRPLLLEPSGRVRGPFAIGSPVHFTSAYMAVVPTAWRERLGGPAVTGNCCRSIIGYQSHGPALSVFDPSALAERKTVPASSLIGYTSQRPLGPDPTGKNPYFNLTTRVDGVVFPENSRSILFFGKHGVGAYCYGDGSDCNDPANRYKGTHAYPYRYQVWAYDALELAPAAMRQAHEPYAVWNFRVPFESDNDHGTGGVAYDAATGRIYFSQLNADSEHRPIIHSFRVSRTSPDTASAGPKPD